MFKKLLWLSIFLLFVWWSSVLADKGWFFIENYTIGLNTQEDGNVFITETIGTNFLEQRHGIYRIIPVWWWFPLIISDTVVPWHKFTTDTTNDSYTIKIWDANKYIMGKQQYKIEYKVFWVIRQFSWYQELYRNLIGLDRNTNINKVNFKINIAKNIKLNPEDIFFYYGPKWSKATGAVSFNYTNGNIVWQLNQQLNAHEALTVGIKFPDKFFTLDPEQTKLLNQYKNQWGTTKISNLGRYGEVGILALPIWFLIVLLFVFWTPKKRQKKVIPQYFPPKGLNSAEAGMLVKNKIKTTDIFSLFYYRAAKGHIKIEMKTKKILLFTNKIFTITALKNLNPDSPKFELAFRKDLFWDWATLKSIELGKNSTKLQTSYTSAVKNLREHIKTLWRYNKAKYSRLLSFWALIVIILTALLAHWNILFVFINTIVVGIIIAIFTRYNNRPTNKGAELKDYVAWYKDFIKKVDETKLKTFLKDDSLFVDKTIAFAVAFGLQSKFMKTISAIIQDTQINTRYIGDPTMDFNNLQHGLASSFTPTQSSGWSWFSDGGGFSGGWGGGWGGGSW